MQKTGLDSEFTMLGTNTDEKIKSEMIQESWLSMSLMPPFDLITGLFRSFSIFNVINSTTTFLGNLQLGLVDQMMI